MTFDSANRGSYISVVARHAAPIAATLLGVTVFMACVGVEPFHGDALNPRGSGGDLLRQLMYGLVFLAILFLHILSDERAAFAGLTPGLTLLLAWCAISLAWSDEPATAIRRFGLTGIVALSVLFSVRTAGCRHSLQALRISLVVILVLNFASVLLTPALAIHQAGTVRDAGLIGSWHGLSIQKNLAGAICAVTIISFIFAAGELRPLLRATVVVAAAIFLLKTHSKTSLAVLVPALAIGWLYTSVLASRRGMLVACALIATLGAGVLALGPLAAPISNALADPNSFTGRAQIWPYLVEYARSHAILGAGFGSFWLYDDNGPITQLTDSWVQEVPNGHNGYLDILVAIGIPGLLLASYALILSPLWRLMTSRLITPSEGALPLAMLVFAAGHNVFESTILARDAEVWVFLLIALASTFQLEKECRLRPR